MQPNRTRALLPLLIVAIALPLAPAPAVARPQEETPGQPIARDEGGQGIYAGEDVPPELMSHFVARGYDVRLKKVWRALLQVLQDSGLPPEIVEEKDRTVRTSYADFKSSNYPQNPVDPPPPFTSRWHILTMKEISQGKAAIEAVVSKGEAGTEVRLRARILVQGLDRMRRIRLLTDRRSSGAIEKDLFQKLDAELGLSGS
jgi:hypothetical protein